MDELIAILKSLNPELELTDTLIDDGQLDSFDIITLVAELSEHYGIDIGAEELVPENFNSAERIYAMILRLGDDL
jgi:acyl carrier protein